MRACLSLSILVVPFLSGCDCCCGVPAPTSQASVEAVQAAPAETLEKEAGDSNWGTIRGQVVYAGAQLPRAETLKIDKDQQCCMPNGIPVLSQTWTVNPQNKGVRWVVVYLKPAPGEKVPVHPSLEKPKEEEVVIDQPNCLFTPHVLVMRKGQKLTAKNPDPVQHNVLITGLKFQDNKNLPVGQNYTWEKDVIPDDYRPMKVSCGQHPWMGGYLYVLEHPYFAVTDADGKFEIQLAPTATQNVVVWHETGLVTAREGKPVEVKGGQVTDLGKIEIKPKN